MGKNIGYLTAGRTKESDEIYTPVYAVEPILKYLKPNSKILCPFSRQRLCRNLEITLPVFHSAWNDTPGKRTFR